MLTLEKAQTTVFHYGLVGQKWAFSTLNLEKPQKVPILAPPCAACAGANEWRKHGRFRIIAASLAS
ncbi:MAG TPA: hypothetical protein VK612_11080 [Pyrinomonadaceae bacterium]|nr:hypothetical protein [Pyrinomonadaceae bacterium]